MKKKTKIAFLDRDGVINSSKINNGYIGKIKDFKWINGSKKAIKYLKSKNYKVVIITNQYKIHSYLKKELKKIGTSVDKIYFCPFHKDGIIKKYKKDSSLRKPKIGMFRLAQKKWNIDKSNSFMIGDQITDIQFAKKANIESYFFQEKNLLKFIKNKLAIVKIS